MKVCKLYINWCLGTHMGQQNDICVTRRESIALSTSEVLGLTDFARLCWPTEHWPASFCYYLQFVHAFPNHVTLLPSTSQRVSSILIRQRTVFVVSSAFIGWNVHSFPILTRLRQPKGANSKRRFLGSHYSRYRRTRKHVQVRNYVNISLFWLSPFFFYLH